MPPEHRRDLHNGSVILHDLKETDSVYKRFLTIHYGAQYWTMRLGLCIPSKCTQDDLTQLLNLGLKQIPTDGEVLHCETKRSYVWKKEQIFVAVFFGIVTGLVITGTFIDFYLSKISEKSTKSASKSMVYNFFLTFSLIQNIKELFQPSNENQSFGCIRCIRICSIVMLISGYTYGIPYASFISFVDSKNNHNSLRESIYGLLGIVTLPTDTLIFFSAFLFGSSCAQVSESYFKLPVLFIKKYLICFFGMLLVIMVFIMLPLFGDGPMWKEMVMDNVDVCYQNGWRNFLFIQNFWDIRENCLFHTWLLSVLLHCSFIGVFILCLLRWKPKFGSFASISLVLASAAAAAIINAQGRFPPVLGNSVVNGNVLYEMFNKVLIPSHTHVTPYIMGIFFGFWFTRRSINVSGKKTAALWIIMLGGSLFVYYIPFDFPYQGQTYQLFSAMYAGTFQIVWSLSLASLLLLSINHKLGYLESMFNYHLWAPLDRTWFLLYLIHPLVIFYCHGRARMLFYLSLTEILIYCLGFTMITIFSSCILYVSVGLPFRKGLKYALSFLEKNRKDNKRSESNFGLQNVITTEEKS